jgi:hypothetical protein
MFERREYFVAFFEFPQAVHMTLRRASCGAEIKSREYLLGTPFFDFSEAVHMTLHHAWWGAA